MLCHLKQRDTKTPNIACDGVALTGDAFGSHVVAGTDEGVGVTLGSELARDAKVTELDLARAGQQDVAGLDIAMNDTVAV